MFRYKLRTLLIVLAVAPAALAGVWLAPGYLQVDELGFIVFALVLGFLGYVGSATLAGWFSRRREQIRSEIETLTSIGCAALLATVVVAVALISVLFHL